MTIYISCRPFHHYWQIYPDPGNVCQAAVSKPILWVSFVSNVSTDTFLFLIPIPMLWKSSLRMSQKLAATLVLSGGVLIVVCAILKSIYVIVVSDASFTLSHQKRVSKIANHYQDPIHGGQLAAAWGTRETFIAVLTTNLPMISPLLRTWLAPLLPKSLRSSNKAYKSPGSGFVTIGGGGASKSSRQGVRSVSRITANMTFDNESEERIISAVEHVKLQNLHSHEKTLSNAIMLSGEVSVTTQELDSELNASSFRHM